MISTLITNSETLSVIGHDRVEIVEVPDFFTAPETLVRGAESLAFAHINPHYPGIRAEVEEELLQALCRAVSDLSAAMLKTPKTEWIGQAWYSIVTQPPEALTPIQRLPHFDGFDEMQWAVMIYLHRTPHGGTAFYRHKTTGFEQITEARYPEYKSKLESDVQNYGLPASQYPESGAPMFERIGQSKGDYNSMTLYPGTVLHSGIIDNHAPLSPEPNHGRLTINGFFRPA